MSFIEKFLMVCDVLFVLILCFVVLLATMLITTDDGTSEVFTGYIISPALLIGVVVSCGFYLAYMLTKSRKSLRELTENMFANEEKKKEK